MNKYLTQQNILTRRLSKKSGYDFNLTFYKNFPKNHPLRKIIKMNTVKISCKCMPNMKQKISAHDFKVLQGERAQPNYGCNCNGVMGEYPLDGNCLVNSVIYRAEIKGGNSDTQTYTGLTSNTFKQRYYGHRHSFNNRNSEHSTTLSSHIWNF